MNSLAWIWFTFYVVAVVFAIYWKVKPGKCNYYKSALKDCVGHLEVTIDIYEETADDEEDFEYVKDVRDFIEQCRYVLKEDK